jgi:ATP-dependent DNA helicase RecQ
MHSTIQSSVIESLLRYYPNILDKKIEISIDKLEQLTKLNSKEIIKSFEFYNKMNLLNLNITNSDLQIYWLKPREDKYSVNPLINKLNEINNIKRIKLEKIIDFIYNDEKCKTRQLLKYFGEKKKHNCMNCSSFCCE